MRLDAEKIIREIDGGGRDVVMAVRALVEAINAASREDEERLKQLHDLHERCSKVLDQYRDLHDDAALARAYERGVRDCANGRIVPPVAHPPAAAVEWAKYVDRRSWTSPNCQIAADFILRCAERTERCEERPLKVGDRVVLRGKVVEVCPARGRHVVDLDAGDIYCPVEIPTRAKWERE